MSLTREEKINRLEKVLKGYEEGRYTGGICSYYNRLFGGALRKDMPEIKPDGVAWGKYWFKRGDISARIQFLKDTINKWSNPKELTVTEQLVSNVNKHGGEIHGLKVGDKLPAEVISAWSKAGKNYMYSGSDKPINSSVPFHNDREITKFTVEEGDVFFEVSGTDNVRLRAKGYKKFAEEYNKPEETYSIGQRFKVHYSALGTQEFILGEVDHEKVSLICLKDGERATDPITVSNPRRVILKELGKLIGCNKWELIK